MDRPPRRRDQLLDKARTFVRRRWMKYVLRDTARASAHRRMDLAYTVRDPWRMDSPSERHRFEESNRILHARLIAPAATVGSILELGCGEGHQSEHLARLCDRLTGLDVSARAVARARARVPSATFVSGDLLAQPWVGEAGRFDVVTAFEVLHYMREIAPVLEAMSRLAPACIVSWYGPTARTTAAAVERMPLEGRQELRHGEIRWTVAWWRNRG
jgi:SAM-dependent methyltransferase